MALLQWFLLIKQDATLQLIAVEPMINFKTSIPVNVQRTSDHGSVDIRFIFHGSLLSF